MKDDINNRFRATVHVRIGESFLAGAPEDNDELQNVMIEFGHAVLSIGVGQMHHVSPTGFQGMEPKRQEVEIAITEAATGRSVTRLFFEEFMKEKIHDDVAVIGSDEIIYVISKVADWDPYGTHSVLKSLDGGLTKGH